MEAKLTRLTHRIVI